MSDLPPPGSGTPPPPPPPEGPGGEPEEPGGEEFSAGPTDGAAADVTPPAGTEAIHGTDDASTFEDPFPTTVMAGGAVAGAAAADPYGAEPGSYPPGEPLDYEEPEPWYRQRGPLIAAIVAGVIALLLAIGLGIWLFGGDDDGANIRNHVVISLVDETGERVQRELTGSVTGPDEFPQSFVWLRPPNAIAPADAVAPASDDNVEFMWAPTEDVTDQETWFSRFVLRETAPAGWVPPSSPVECILERSGSSDSIVQMTVTVEPPDVEQRSEVTYQFPDHVFVPGDTVSCTLVSTRPPPDTTTTSSTTTSVPESTSTTSSTTSTVPETTTTESTTTTSTTTTTTTSTTTTTTTTTEPPVGQTAWEVLEKTPGVEDFVAALDACGFMDELNDPNATLTVFAPLELGVPDEAIGTCEGVDSILMAQIHTAARLSRAELDDLAPGELEMMGGIMVTLAEGPVIGGAQIDTEDIPASNATIHVVDKAVDPAV